MRSRKVGNLKIQFEVLEKMLGLPDEARIENAYCDIFGGETNIVNIAIRCPNLGDVMEGEVMPDVTLAQIRGYDE